MLLQGALGLGKTDHLESAAAMSCIDMGYSRDLVKKAIDIYINKHDGNFASFLIPCTVFKALL